LAEAFDGREVWGADLMNDLKSLDYDPQQLPFDASINDIQRFYRDFKGDPISLSLLSRHFIGEDIQEKCHSSIADARLTAICYKKMQRLKAEGMERFSCPEMDLLRADAPKKPTVKWDRCTCGSSKSKGKKKRFPLNHFNNIPEQEWEMYY